ncbi:MAG: hypothetical protein ACP5UI_01420, partial [Thermoprotei archaeon]
MEELGLSLRGQVPHKLACRPGPFSKDEGLAQALGTGLAHLGRERGTSLSGMGAVSCAPRRTSPGLDVDFALCLVAPS